MITKLQARTIAATFLSEEVELEFWPEVPEGLHDVDPGKEFLFACIRRNRLGSTEYVAVSKATGVARLAGEIGE